MQGERQAKEKKYFFVLFARAAAYPYLKVVQGERQSKEKSIFFVLFVRAAAYPCSSVMQILTKAKASVIVVRFGLFPIFSTLSSTFQLPFSPIFRYILAVQNGVHIPLVIEVPLTIIAIIHVEIIVDKISIGVIIVVIILV